MNNDVIKEPYKTLFHIQNFNSLGAPDSPIWNQLYLDSDKLSVIHFVVK